MSRLTKNRIINPGMTNWPMEFDAAVRLREWALRGLGLPQVMRVSFARTSCMQATADAAKEGREFTPIYWYFVDLDTTPVLTLWDMNER